MNKADFFIDPDISKASTLPATFYKSDEVFERLKSRVFHKAWHFAGDTSLLPFDQSVYPVELLPGFLSEPIVLTKRSDDYAALSNICTHRGNIVVHYPGKQKNLNCMYHGRRFGLDGTFQHMPEFENVQDFPTACDHLTTFEIKNWENLLFVCLDPNRPFAEMMQPVFDRMGFLPLQQYKYDANRSKDYLVNCHWALYCDNYLEGFHIPFVHQDLNAVLDYGQYATLTYPYVNLQIGYNKDGGESFDLPSDHPDFGQSIGAYYFWIFPNTMLNFYPWGLSINVVKPINRNKTKVSFLSYVYDEHKIELGAGAALDKVEREDEFVVEGVHKGIQSTYYRRGRFSPTREQGVHQFHRLLFEALFEEGVK